MGGISQPIMMEKFIILIMLIRKLPGLILETGLYKLFSYIVNQMANFFFVFFSQLECSFRKGKKNYHRINRSIAISIGGKSIFY